MRIPKTGSQSEIYGEEFIHCVSLRAIEEKPKGPTAEEQATRFQNLVLAVESERNALQLRRALVARRRELLSE